MVQGPFCASTLGAVRTYACELGCHKTLASLPMPLESSPKWKKITVTMVAAKRHISE